MEKSGREAPGEEGREHVVILTEGERQGGSRASFGSCQDFSALRRNNSRMSALNWNAKDRNEQKS